MDIKFRAWDKEKRKFIGIYEITKDCICDVLVQYGVNNIIWMKFTGLKDKNGEEIYDGDILEHCDTRIVVNPIIPISRFYGSEQEDDWISMSNLDWEVIGNIYKNIDLL